MMEVMLVISETSANHIHLAAVKSPPPAYQHSDCYRMDVFSVTHPKHQSAENVLVLKVTLKWFILFILMPTETKMNLLTNNYA